jgi:hypothetical protein
MQYLIETCIKYGKEIRTVDLNSYDSINMRARIQACASLYKKVIIEEVTENSYKLTCAGKKIKINEVIQNEW